MTNVWVVCGGYVCNYNIHAVMAQLTVINRIVTPATEVIYTYIIIVPFITVSWVITVDHGFINNKHHGWADLV